MLLHVRGIIIYTSECLSYRSVGRIQLHRQILFLNLQVVLLGAGT